MTTSVLLSRVGLTHQSMSALLKVLAQKRHVRTVVETLNFKIETLIVDLNSINLVKSQALHTTARNPIVGLKRSVDASGKIRAAYPRSVVGAMTFFAKSIALLNWKTSANTSAVKTATVFLKKLANGARRPDSTPLS